jgi:hypothetical protein
MNENLMGQLLAYLNYYLKYESEEDNTQWGFLVGVT